MKIVLVYPNQTELEELNLRFKYAISYRDEPLIPLGILYIASNLDPHHEVVFIDNNIERFSNKRLFKEIMSHKPDIVGFGGTMMEWLQAMKVSQMLRKEGIPTIYGGPNATVRSEKHINYFDFIVRGEGEITINELLDCLEQGKKPEGILGVWYKENGNIVRNDDRPPIEYLENLKYPLREAVNIDRYKRDDDFPIKKPSDVVVSSRGCPFSCRFCSSKYFWKRQYRTRKVEDVIEEIKYIIDKYGTRTIHFREDLFTANRDRVFSFCEKLKDLGVDWICQSRVNLIDEPLLKLMKDSGCKGISFGFESANEHTLQFLNKGTTVKENIDAIELCEKVGMNWSGGFMAGVINEGEEDIKRTFEFVNKVSSYEHSFLPNGAARFLGFPVSETYFQMIEEGLVAFDWLDGELLIPRTRHLTDKEVERIFDEHYNRIRDEDGSRTLTFSLKQNIKKMLPIWVTKHLMEFRRIQKWKNMII